MHLHGRDSYGCYLCIEAFAIDSATTSCCQSHTITYGCLRICLSYTTVISVMNYILSAVVLIRVFLCISVRICAFRVRLAFSNVLLRIAVTFYYVSTLIFHSCKMHLKYHADTIRTAKDICVYDTHIYG